MPLGSHEGGRQAQALEYLKAEGRDAQVRLRDVGEELAGFADEKDALEATAVIAAISQRLAPGDGGLDALRSSDESVSVRDVALAMDEVMRERDDLAAVDTVQMIATRLLKYVDGPGQQGA